MNFLLSGPPASGKSHAALERFRSLPGSLLIVPTATMAEHLRHSLARSGFPIRPSSIQTLAHFLDEWSDKKAAPEPLVHFLITRALERQRPKRFQSVVDYPGFLRALVDLFAEIPVSGLSGDLAPLFAEVERELDRRGMALRNRRLASAIRCSATHLVFDGFFSLSAAELGMVLSLASSASVTVTLPDGTGAASARQTLLSAGFVEERSTRPLRAARTSEFSAATMEREVEEIARRILLHAAEGRAFREIAIVLRTRDPYAPLVETTLARFGIPARLYFRRALGSHPALSYLASLIRAMLAGWDHALLLAALRMPVSGVGATASGDQLDFEWRAKLPQTGLPLPSPLDRAASLDSWRREHLDPTQWAERLKILRTLLPDPQVTDRAGRDQIFVWRSTAAALTAFDGALDGTASALEGSGRIGLSQFWKQVELALALDPLRVPDDRRNVVHVMDAYEARQWELPVVFVCGLTERHFPQYHREDPIIGDAARNRAGLDTAADRQLEERFLFELATTRATQETVLSYPRYDERGEETLPSLFLNGEAFPPAAGLPPRVPASRPATARVAPISISQTPIQDPAMVERLTQTHKRLSPTSIESFLQCPFQFFAGKTLRLRPRPPAPRDRLDVLVQGSILHHALAESTREPLFGVELMQDIFNAECSRLHIPRTYRTEAVRLELLRHFRRFLEEGQLALPDWSTRVEEKFTYALNPLVQISGRIDRMDTGPAGQALVIDYKYSAADKIYERVANSGAGDAVQAGLYLAAAERAFGLDPVGMLFCGLKKDVTWDGWHKPIEGLKSVGESCTREVLRDLMDNAERIAVETYEAITSGRIAVDPTDRYKCKWCDFRDTCRVGTMAVARRAGRA